MKQDIIHIALENLQKTVGIGYIWHPQNGSDGKLDILLNDKKKTFFVEVKKELRWYQLYQIEEKYSSLDHVLIIAEQIFPKIKEALREKEIAYLETNGNVFLKTDEIYLYVDTHKKYKNLKEGTNKAFTKTGLKVLFHLLNDKDLVNKTQREIAVETGVALGNIPQIIDGLIKTGYLLPLNKRDYIWKNRKELLARWVDEYAINLRPKLIKNRYSLKTDWQKIKLNTKKTVWGGEPAADLLTNHLRPGKFTLYTKELNVHLIKNYKLTPQDDGEVEVLEMFWDNEKTDTKNKKCAPPLLIYADLIITGGKRNLETAKKIYDEYIGTNI